jgi:long-chain fatty acid transport protein
MSRGFINKSVMMLAASTALVAVTATSASAGGFAIREQSVTGLGAAFAGIAAGGPSISGMFWNPAVITQQPGLISESHLSVIVPKTDITVTRAQFETLGGPVPIAGPRSSGDIGQDALVPASYGSFQVNDKLFLGVGVTAPFGLVTNPNDTWAGRFHALTSSVFTLNVNPVAAYKVNDWFSVALGLQINYLEARLLNSVPIGLVAAGAGIPGVPFGAEGVAQLNGDDWGFGATAGITLKPMEGTTIGIGFRSAVKHTLKGNGIISDGGVLSAGVGTIPLGGFTGDITLPETVTLGIRQKVFESTTLLFGAEWANWSRFNELRVNFQAPPAPFPTTNLTTQNYGDSWFVSGGIEHQWNDKLMTRAGVGFEKSPVKDAFRTPRLPDNDRLWLSVGASYQVADWVAVDAAYTFISVDDAPINLVGTGENAARGTLVANSEAQLHLFGVAARFQWGAEGAPKFGLFN